MTLLEKYNQAIARAEIVNDPLQRKVILHFQRIADELNALNTQNWFKHFFKQKLIKGLYLYGSVGVGKTYLMDLFYNGILEEKKSRFHFHHFMQQVDAQLRRLQGQKDPVKKIAANLAKTTRLLCLDEFLVHDVADAMILAELLSALFAHGIILVTTANTRPDDLYKNGVHRERFIPAIELIKLNCEELLLTEDRDYRLGRIPQLEAYLYPLNQKASDILTKQFSELSPQYNPQLEINIQNREIPVIKSSDHAVWFDFNVICNLPRSQLDYLEIADRFDTVFVSNIPALKPEDTARGILFVHFIDVMYDRAVRLIVSAAVPANEIYAAGPLSKTFQRTISRLEEMQSSDYLLRNSNRRSSVQF